LVNRFAELRVMLEQERAVRSGLADLDPMVRIGAVDMLEEVPSGQIRPLASPLPADLLRGVMIGAACLLASVPTASHSRHIRTGSTLVSASPRPVGGWCSTVIFQRFEKRSIPV
jgi:hypothetical protein